MVSNYLKSPDEYFIADFIEFGMGIAYSNDKLNIVNK